MNSFRGGPCIRKKAVSHANRLLDEWRLATTSQGIEVKIVTSINHAGFH